MNNNGKKILRIVFTQILIPLALDYFFDDTNTKNDHKTNKKKRK